jgi:isoamylase
MPRNGVQRAAELPTTYTTRSGRPHPLGATPDAAGVNFAVFSRNATGVELLLFDNHDDAEPAQAIRLDPDRNRSFFFWHVYVEGLSAGVHYAYRVDGPAEPGTGHRFNRNKVLIDPYARGNTKTLWNREAACGPEDNLTTSMRSVVIDVSAYDWEGDRPLNRPTSEIIIYEMHVGGFTASASAGVQHPGTFRGVVEKIPYLQELGVTAVELLPVFEFDDTAILRQGPDGPLTNYWGYSTIGFFAPASKYCVMPESGRHVEEFRDMVKALHRAGISVILDVVFNHTDEGNHLGPTINFKGLDNTIYYHLVASDRQYYMDYSGCGNTVNCNHPIVQKLIVECLEYWVSDMHVDGFRFDEGSILTRGEDGAPMAYPPVVWSIELSEQLLDTKVIAEAWDAGGLYQIGFFPGYRWSEWNGRYRDDVRRFVKGDTGLLGAVASRIAGSADIYQPQGHLPLNSINFVTCHDGFTLNDLVSYDEKHNWPNGECNRDGANDNLSWNCGVEGALDDPAVEALRLRQIRNFTTILLLSQGVPMFVAGDEVRRTQQGNNNAYCQDNALSWFDWSLVARNRDLLRFYRQIIGFRKRNAALHRPRYFTGAVNARGLKDMAWSACRLAEPDWKDPAGHALAFTMGGFGEEPDFHVMMNMYWEPLVFDVPPGSGSPAGGLHWVRVVDTALPAPDDIADPGSEVAISSLQYTVGGRSVVVLTSQP